MSQFIEDIRHIRLVCWLMGVEYFVARNISLSATVDLGICKTWTKGTYDNSDNDENNYSRVEYSNFKLKTGQFGGNLAMNFYF